MHLRHIEQDMLPENTPVDRFFKYAFTKLDEGDVKSLVFVVKDVFLDLCATLRGCERAEVELENLYRRRFNELDIHMAKMRKLGMLFQRLVAYSNDVGTDDV